MGRWAVLGGMMGGAGTGAWLLVWVLLGLIVVIGGGILAAVALGSREQSGPSEHAVAASESEVLRRARDALRWRYANGEISREEFLQGTVELED